MTYWLLASLCRPWSCVHSLPTSCDPPAVASGLVCVFLHYDHLVRNRQSGMVESSLTHQKKKSHIMFLFLLTRLHTNLSFCHSPVCRDWKHHDFCNGCLPFPDPNRIPQRASSDAALCRLLCIWSATGVRGEL